MFPFDADCSYCSNLDPKNSMKGKFYCRVKKEYVSANDHLCSKAHEVMGRPNCDKAALRRISKDHGYYVVTAICSILGLDEDNEYLSTFKYLRDSYMPKRDEYSDFIEYYEEFGPQLAELLEQDEEGVEYAEYLRTRYLNGVVGLFCQDSMDEAIALYQAMLSAIATRYSKKLIQPRPVQLQKQAKNTHF